MGLWGAFFPPFILYKWGDGSDERSNCVQACNSDFIFLVTDLDQKNCRVRASPLFILGWKGMLMNRCTEY